MLAQGYVAIPPRHTQIQADSSVCSPPHLLTQTQGLMNGWICTFSQCYWHTQVWTQTPMYLQTHTFADIACHMAPRAAECLCTLVCAEPHIQWFQGRGMRWPSLMLPLSSLPGSLCPPFSPWKAVTPHPGTHVGPPFYTTFYLWHCPCLLHAHGWGGRCVQHELGWGRPHLGLNWAQGDVLRLG